MADVETNSIPSAGSEVAGTEKSGVKAIAWTIIVILVIGLGGLWAFIRAISPSPSVSKGSYKQIMPLDSFTVNLADHEDGRFLRTTISLGVDGDVPKLEKSETKESEVGPVSMATVRDSILTVLSESKSDDLVTAEGKVKLKSDLINALNRDVPALQVKEVYFTEFLVQR